MIKYIANWRLNAALVNMGAPTKIINQKSRVFQEVIEDMKYGGLSPGEGAKLVLNALDKAFDVQNEL
jgi:hypothetical protein